MTDIDVSRSVRFVSLDTHPANNSLVVTYEILVIVSDLHRGHELTRRAKRDQLQISISALDNLTENDLKKSTANKLTLNLRQLSEEIINKCPVLHYSETNSQALEDIQLHLLYLFNRKQSQLYQTNPDRPGSSASSRLRSATPSSVSRLSSARQGSALTRLSSSSDNNKKSAPLSDVYAALCEKELKNGGGWQSCASLDALVRLNGFMDQFEVHLSELEAELQIDRALVQNQSDSLEAQLEGLYGETNEKQVAMAIIRWHIADDQKLANMGENRLLICAMLRSLQDSDTKDTFLSESILFCLIRFTQFEDVYRRLFTNSPTDPIDPVRVVIDLLDEHVKLLQAKQDSLALFINHFYNINSLIIILNNLMSLDLNNSNAKMRKKLILQHGKRLASIVIGLFSLISRHIASFIRQQTANKYERLTLVVSELTYLSQCLSVFKEFVYLIRMKSQTLVESLAVILNTLQLCRPGSGSVQSSGQGKQQNTAAAADQLLLVRDQVILGKIYELEIEILKLVNNLIYDTRFKSRLIRKNLLLKCVLRNLVVFLASSRRSNTLAPFERSSVLMVPFKSLYELSCNNQIKQELYKSKLITKCLFEYLLSSTADLKTRLDSLVATTTAPLKGQKVDKKLDQSSMDDDQIILNPTQASHYIIAIWINLSANKSAPFYNNSSDACCELVEPLADYIDLSTQNLITFVSILRSNGGDVSSKGASKNFQGAQLMLYIHAKLLRNLTQFLSFTLNREQSTTTTTTSRSWTDHYTRWVERLASLIDQLLLQPSDNHLETPFVVPMLVECVAILANLMGKSGAFWQLSEGGDNNNGYNDDDGAENHQKSLIPLFDWPKELESILTKLFRVNLVACANMDGEHDDLLLVSINLLGTLARYREICNELKSLTPSIIDICNFILESKSTDTEMIISCLYTLSQLENHFVFLQAISLAPDDSNQSSLDDSGKLTAIDLLVDKLANLIMHGDLGASKMANSILNNLKQFEEQQSLSDSVTCKRRFMCYNSKWLNAIKANRDDPTTGDDGDGDGGGDALDVSEIDPVRRRESATRGKNQTDEEANLIDDLNQLRTINEDSQSRMSASSSNRSSNLLGERDDYDEENDDFNVGQSQSSSSNNKLERTRGESLIDDGDRDDDEEDDDYDEEENFSEPDLNVIDPNSMIKHLTNRREFRSEILMRK